MGWSADDVELVSIDWLKPHEEIRVKNMKQLKMMTLRWGGYTKPLLADADVVLVLESDVPWVPSYQAPSTDATIIHFGTDPLFENYPIRGFACDLAVTGVLRASLPALSDALAEREPRCKDRIERRRTRVGEFRDRQRAGWAEVVDAAATEMPIHPAWLSHCIDRIKDDDTIVIKESPLSLEHMTFNQPLTLFYGLGAGGLGWGQGAALGAKLAAPERDIIAVSGDGFYMFGTPAPAIWAAAHQDPGDWRPEVSYPA